VTTEWIWDDPEIPHDELFLRRIPRKPAFVVPNLVTKQLEVKAAALRFDDDGMSVTGSRILADEGHDRGDFCDWRDYTAVEFPAGAARATEEAGVIYDPVDDHPQGNAFGKAHSLVHPRTPNPDKVVRRNIQAAIAAQCRWVDEDPYKPG